ncbi:MAG: ABC transporter substrate-binding protein [Gammaproteobacteria bacterium]|nr:ABC transporter substrate-binding protein [Gammaproteobacteria bacterium]
MKSHLTLLFLTLLGITSTTHAFNNYHSQPNQPQDNPVQTIQNTLDKLQKFSENKDNTRPELLRRFIENEIIPHFAFDQMTYWIAGPYARHMNTSNMAELESRVKKTFLSSLDKHLSSYNASSTRMNIRSAQYRGPNDVTVSTLLLGSNQRPDRLDFRMQAQGDHWKIIDVTANGLSAALYYRRHFISTLRQYR